MMRVTLLLLRMLFLFLFGACQGLAPPLQSEQKQEPSFPNDLEELLHENFLFLRGLAPFYFDELALVEVRYVWLALVFVCVVRA